MPPGHIGRRPRSQRRRGQARATIASCPSSTPRLKVSRLGARSARGSSSARQRAGEAEPVHQAEAEGQPPAVADGGSHPFRQEGRPEGQEVFHAHRDDAEGNQRLDEARRRDHPPERGKGQGRGVGEVKAVTMPSSCRKLPPSRSTPMRKAM